MKPTIITLTGPSCAGKSTLEKLLRDVGMVPLISTTTREPRSGELNGAHYNFISKEEFLHLREHGNLIEDVTFGEHFYGLARGDVNEAIAQNKPAVVVVEPKGRNQIVAFGKRHGWNIHTVFVDNPTHVIAERFMERFATEVVRTESVYPIRPLITVYAKRLAVMMENEQRWRDEAYEGVLGLYPYHLLVREFNAKNQKEIVRQVCSLVSSKDWIKKAA